MVAAAQAEIAGDASRILVAPARRDPQAIPTIEIARWQLGQVQLDGKWVTVEEAQRRAAADPLQAEYRQRRAAAGPSVRDQLALARWCRDNKLGDEAELHWAVVLSLDPTNKEALRAVDMLWKDGRLVNRNETAQQKQQAQAAKNAAKRWEPIIAKWRRAVARPRCAGPRRRARRNSRHHAARCDSFDRSRHTRPRCERHASTRKSACRSPWRSWTRSKKCASQAATESLLRHAVLSPGNKARNSAIEKLKARDPHDFVPMLLSGLAMPIESSYNVTTDADGGVRYSHTLYREGAESDWSLDVHKGIDQQNLGGRTTLYDVFTGQAEVGPLAESSVVVAAKKAAVASAAQNRYGQTAAATETEVARANQVAEELNSRAIPVLAATTGKDFGDNPKAWWDWWIGQNGYEAGERPVDQHYDSEYDHYYYGFPRVSEYSSAPAPSIGSSGTGGGRCECFAKGTLVWTKTGQLPIETVELGDFVLSQNVNTGELKYKPVLGKTIRPPSPMLRIAIENEQLVTTLGHPFWVPGTGWRMAKELGDDAKLHGTTGVTRLKSVEAAPMPRPITSSSPISTPISSARRGVLVHDNTPRRPTQAMVPGLTAK